LSVLFDRDAEINKVCFCHASAGFPLQEADVTVALARVEEK